MGNICVVCKKLVEVDCCCDKAVRFYYNHEKIHNEELLEKKKFQSLKFLEEIQKELQTNYNIILQGHSDGLNSVAVTSDRC